MHEYIRRLARSEVGGQVEVEVERLAVKEVVELWHQPVPRRLVGRDSLGLALEADHLGV